MVGRTVKPFHFEDFGGAEFERLVFAYHLREGWEDLAWYGQTGSDQGRDIIGKISAPEKHIVVQCVNRARLTQKKAEDDMSAVAAVVAPPKYEFRFVCRSAVSAAGRDSIAKFADKLGFAKVTIWSGSEFEEQLRLRAEFLLKRFFDGETFPDTVKELRSFAQDFSDVPDHDVLAMLVAVLDRPAFQTPFQSETNLPAFQKAIEDTVAALNTGIWKDRDGTEIKRIPSIHHIKNPASRAGMKAVSEKVDELRRTFRRGLQSGAVRHCNCGDKNCPAFMIDAKAANELNYARRDIFRELDKVYPHHGLAVR